MKGHFIGMFAQDKWKLNNNLTVNLGARYDIEILPTPNQDNPLFADDPDGYPMDLNNISPRLGFSWALDDAGRSAVRGGFGVFYQRTSYTFLTNMFSAGRILGFVHRRTSRPTTSIPVRGRATSRPIRSWSTVRWSIARCSTRSSRRERASATAARCASTTPIATTPIRAPTASATSGRSDRRWACRSTSSAPSSANQYVLKELNPLVRSGTLATNPVTRTNPLVGTVGEWAASVVTLEPVGYINYNSVQVSGTKRYGNNWQARMSYAFSRGRGNTANGPGRRVATRSSSAISIWTTNTGRPPSIVRTS